MSELEEFFASKSELFIKQKKEWLEIFTDIETVNQYTIFDKEKNIVGHMVEAGGGFFRFIFRNFLRSHRPLDVSIANSSGQVLLKLKRPFYWFFSSLYVYDYSGREIGSVHKKLSILRKNYDMLDARENCFAKIRTAIISWWSFPVYETKSDKEKSLISKKWGGLLKEVFTDTDTFLVDFRDHPWSIDQKAIIFATATSIDLDYFEENHERK